MPLVGSVGLSDVVAMLAVFYLMVAKPGSWAQVLPF
ncbi:hypothetical protein J2X04_002295 [Lysobacter niabensis]|uniref:Uncharacterized protein n=1 Tax=Agrilutibacter niabensis TaxID=380628 RepID=A0ABU1VQZ9_9GAMM|nr:hypothetical protein [Lysobacter niabensis]